jgi:hypothetical protein
MTPEFRRDLEGLQKAVFSQVEPKKAGGQPLSGPAMASLIRLVADALSSGGLSDIPGRYVIVESRAMNTF